ncbi:MAG TPA: thiopeptide-type bacteriocin biosynthesis protein, partial [Thermoanaerobaculia bacterium]|nr:thiopeptide-type bacteriocin biosynthesis protein [Thermoanaerobaculia bacterium]
AHGPEGRFVHEVVVPYVQVRPPVKRAVAPLIENVPRSFAPGSEWLYAKLYAADSVSDRLLAGPLRELVPQLRASGAVDRWFFIRYADPDVHLRVRFRGDPARLQADVLPALHAIADGHVWKLQLDTYERELERYPDIDASERVFDADSDAAMQLVTIFPDADARWWLALAGTDLLLRDLGLELESRRRVIADAWRTTAADIGGGVAFRRQINDRFRRHREKVEALLSGTDAELAEGLDVLRARSARLQEIAPALRDREQLAGSYIHMHINRMLRSEQRLQEVALYAFLDRHYEGKVRRG